MREVVIQRDNPSPLGTFGVLKAGMFSAYTLELNDHGNRPGISCIPAGSYNCVLGDFPRHGKCYEVLQVPKRSSILIHIGNFGADDGHGKSDIEGCILVGNSIGEIAGQKCLLSSKDAFTRFMAEMDGASFRLTIKQWITT